MTRETAIQIEDAAARWVASMEADEWDETAEAQLASWLAGDPRRSGALLQAQAALSVLDSVDGEGQPLAADAPPAGRVHRRWVLGGAGAAIAASFAGALTWYLPGKSYQTDLGEIRRVPLADGSTAAINTASAVKVDLREKLRLVRVERGEAWFQVAKDPGRPFLVEAGRVRVRAVGTAFSVRLLDNGADVLVTEGVVAAWADGADGQMVQISAGGRAFIGNNAAIERSASEASGVDRALAWRNGKIALVGQPLSEAVDEFNRYNRRKLVIGDPGLRDERFDGVFRTDDPAGFALVIKATLEVPVDLSDPERIVIGAARS
jgi:transmembrane sensor